VAGCQGRNSQLAGPRRMRKGFFQDPDSQSVRRTFRLPQSTGPSDICIQISDRARDEVSGLGIFDLGIPSARCPVVGHFPSSVDHEGHTIPCRNGLFA
jgi:hypothetical protein